MNITNLIQNLVIVDSKVENLEKLQAQIEEILMRAIKSVEEIPESDSDRSAPPSAYCENPNEDSPQ